MRAEDSCQCSLREEKPTGPCPLPLNPFCVSVPLVVPYAVIYSFLLLCVSLSSRRCHTNRAEWRYWFCCCPVPPSPCFSTRTLKPNLSMWKFKIKETWLLRVDKAFHQLYQLFLQCQPVLIKHRPRGQWDFVGAMGVFRQLICYDCQSIPDKFHDDRFTGSETVVTLIWVHYCWNRQVLAHSYTLLFWELLFSLPADPPLSSELFAHFIR